jgi:hypothetical protein
MPYSVIHYCHPLLSVKYCMSRVGIFFAIAISALNLVSCSVFRQEQVNGDLFENLGRHGTFVSEYQIDEARESMNTCTC